MSRQFGDTFNLGCCLIMSSGGYFKLRCRPSSTGHRVQAIVYRPSRQYLSLYDLWVRLEFWISRDKKRRSAVSRRAPIDLAYNTEAEAKDRIEQWIPQTIIQCPEITDAYLNSEYLWPFKIAEHLASEMHPDGYFLFNIVFIVQHIVTRYCLELTFMAKRDIRRCQFWQLS